MGFLFGDAGLSRAAFPLGELREHAPILLGMSRRHSNEATNPNVDGQEQVAE
jgi:hypothetical protein